MYISKNRYEIEKLYSFFTLNLFAFYCIWEISKILKSCQECPFCFSHFFSLLLFCSLSHLHKAVKNLSLQVYYLLIFISPISGLPYGHVRRFAK